MKNVSQELKSQQKDSQVPETVKNNGLIVVGEDEENQKFGFTKLKEEDEDEEDDDDNGDDREEVTLEKVDTASFSIDTAQIKSTKDAFDALIDAKPLHFANDGSNYFEQPIR